MSADHILARRLAALIWASLGWVETRRIARFGVVGILATFVYLSATFIAVEVFGFSAIPASVIGQAMSVGISYFGHSMFSFQVATDHRVFLWRFIMIAIVAFAMNIAVIWGLTERLGFSYQISMMIVTILVPTMTYLCNRFWVFLPGLSFWPKTIKAPQNRCASRRV